MSVGLDRASASRAATLTLAGLSIAAAAFPVPASAQSLFESFFGSFNRHSGPSLPARSQAYADPGAPSVAAPESPSIGAGQTVAYCVRLCDGRYFPIQRQAAATPVQLCNALCPASKTKVFSGSEIKGAAAADGTRYADLDHSFLYRERLVPNCTCNGRDAFGLAPIDINADPTLRRGDVVATDDGLKEFTGARTKRGQTAEFTPVDKSALSSDARRKLTSVSVTPAR